MVRSRSIKNLCPSHFLKNILHFYLDSRQEPLPLRFPLSLALCLYPKGFLAMLASEVRGSSISASLEAADSLQD